MPTKNRFHQITVVFSPLFGAAHAAGPLLEHPVVELAHQIYQEDTKSGLEGVRVESWYLKGSIEITEETGFRYQLLEDTITGGSPVGGTDPTTGLPVFVPIDDVRRGLMGALSQKLDDHLLSLEFSESVENDYLSYNFALTDVWELNQKNTTLNYGLSYTDDKVGSEGSEQHLKKNYEAFVGVNQILDKNTVLSAALTVGLNRGYLNDPRKAIERTETGTTTELVPIYDDSDPPQLIGYETIELPYTNLVTYPENRPDSRLRGVLQFGVTRYFEDARGALDVTYRLAGDSYEVLSNTLQCEWRQTIGEHWLLVPYLRYYRQNAAEFYYPTLDGINPDDPNQPDGSSPNYSSDYRLSSLSAVSAGLRLRYQFNVQFGAYASYERYVMNSESSNQAPDVAYPSADIWSIGLSANF